MVAKITTPQSCHRAVYYNENKVEENKAFFLHAANFLKETNQLTLIDKKAGFDRLISLNQGVHLHTLHVSLNFDPSEKLDKNQLIAIATDYMKGIGFGDQPYLVYQHVDAGHPHIHIVSVNVRRGEGPIDMNMIGKNKSEPIRKEIEIKYGLVKAGEQHKKKKSDIYPLDIQKLEYGKSESKRAITNVLDFVLSKYKFCSLHELNALLYLYNLKADAGKPGSRIHHHKGLVYQMIDEKGQGIGMRIKSSSIYSRPGLAFLEKKFAENKTRREPDLPGIRTRIDLLLRSQPKNWPQLAEGLKKKAFTQLLT